MHTMVFEHDTLVLRMKHITSDKNPVFKELKQLATSSSARRKSGKTIVDGAHVAHAYLEKFGMPELCAFTANAQENTETHELIRCCWDGGVECVELSLAHYRDVSPVENGVGLLFVIKTPHKKFTDRLQTSALLLDGVQDPGNLGTMLRTAAAAGVTQIFCSPDTVAAWSPKVVRAGMGAHFSLDIYENADLSQVIELSDVEIIATSSHATEAIYEANLQRPIAWLFGNEGQGVDEELLQKATKQLAIPHAGDMESLNVSVATAVCLFEQMRQQKYRE